MHIDLVSKTALVTGSTSGMGYATAKALAVAGARVVVHGSSDETVSGAVDRLRQDVPGSDVAGHSARLEDPDAVSDLIDAVPDVDILVSNAGPTHSTSVFDISLAEWRAQLDIYLTAGMLLGRHHLARMIDRGWGRMLFGAGLTCSYSPAAPSLDTMTAWLTCKSAMLGLSRGFAEIAAGRGVTVNSFVPGPTMTEEKYLSIDPPMDGTFEQFGRDYFTGPGSSSLLRRFLQPDEVANFIVFLASPQASGITGAALRVDGGIIRSIL
ncbi:SDR family NAD(P)-dependent oxidoreductase [Fodinicola acaciae]|uniref:SDR family NAD(P)-dependent oxidoreductase n=1 Tax=Fodinicola acaciae TaxID=2681555 RepID=UPI0013D45219|nr:SDR family oxidoreductase [Fodinicola acaciae]